MHSPEFYFFLPCCESFCYPCSSRQCEFLEVTDACIVAITTVICCAERAEESVI